MVWLCCSIYFVVGLTAALLKGRRRNRILCGRNSYFTVSNLVAFSKKKNDSLGSQRYVAARAACGLL